MIEESTQSYWRMLTAFVLILFCFPNKILIGACEAVNGIQISQFSYNEDSGELLLELIWNAPADYEGYYDFIVYTNVNTYGPYSTDQPFIEQNFAGLFFDDPTFIELEIISICEDAPYPSSSILIDLNDPELDLSCPIPFNINVFDFEDLVTVVWDGPPSESTVTYTPIEGDPVIGTTAFNEIQLVVEPPLNGIIEVENHCSEGTSPTLMQGIGGYEANGPIATIDDVEGIEPDDLSTLCDTLCLDSGIYDNELIQLGDTLNDIILVSAFCSTYCSTIIGLEDELERNVIYRVNNPFEDKLNIQLNINEKANISISLFNQNAQLLNNGFIEEQVASGILNREIPTGVLEAGIYFLVVRLDDRQYVRKLVKL